MTIERGADWGERSTVPGDAVVARTDREASLAVASARRQEAPLPSLALVGGDLVRTLGGRGAVRPGEEATHVRVDLGAALLDGRLHWFLAHLVARRSWLRGRIVVAANAAFLGSWNIAPRAHPGDGRLDVLDGDPPLRTRLQARRRVTTGTHVPHPDIAVTRREAIQLELDRPTAVRLDGEPAGAARTLSIRVEPAAVDVWI